MSKSKKVLSALLASAVLLGGASAYASSHPEKQAAFEQAAISAAQAVQTATGKVAGKATEVDFKFKNGSSYYKVDVLRDNQGNAEKHEVVVDAKTGEVLADNVETKSHKKDKAYAEAKVSLEQAIDIAAQKTGGKVKEADLEAKKGASRYEIESIKDGKKYKTVVDAASGEVISSGVDY
ncbi:PepSY domain-containing protein [Bisgaard Taxon 10/6]|uniref:PepSY domain-containing protein n=1 Tax=Exercitatus varius TaxID=67857 RepID=UPI00294B46CC|nr:PepSY domain-containing protein [Exercitatus varius]MDG2960709.1 PepSY domain-containing protein [Exercitatus varius]